MKFTFSILATFMMTASCLAKAELLNPSLCKETERYENIVRVFMARIDAYNVLIRTPNGPIVARYLWANSSNILIYDDVPAEKPMYAIAKNCGWSGGYGLDIHVHSVRDINGSGYQSGKTSGSNNVLE